MVIDDAFTVGIGVCQAKILVAGGVRMGQGRDDLAALLRCWRFGLGLPAAIRFGSRMLTPLMVAYDDVVAPVVTRIVRDPDERTRVNRAIRAMSVKIGEAMVSYAWLADCEPQLEIAALAGSVTRLYDDLIDGGSAADETFDHRLNDLFNEKSFTPGNDLEQLLACLVGEIRYRLDLKDGDIAVNALITLHEYQCLSRRQREAEIPLAVLDKICCGKGAMANLTLCTLVNPRMEAAEQELVMALGEALQSLDDYMDVDLDTRNGVVTLASMGVTTLADIASRISALRKPLAERYGASRTRRYYGMIYFLLIKSVVGRRLPILGRVAGRLAGRSDTLVILTRGAEVVP